MGRTISNIQIMKKDTNEKINVKETLVDCATQIGYCVATEEDAHYEWRWIEKENSSFISLDMPLEDLCDDSVINRLAEVFRKPIIQVLVMDSDFAVITLQDNENQVRLFLSCGLPEEVQEEYGQDWSDVKDWERYLPEGFKKEDVEDITNREYLYAEDLVFCFFEFWGMEEMQIDFANEGSEQINTLYLTNI